MGALPCGFLGHGFSFHLVFHKASANLTSESRDVNAGLATCAALSQVTQLN